MNCPACRKADSRIRETRCYDGRAVARRRECGNCGARWTSEERLIKGSLTTLPTTTGSTPVAHRCDTGSTPVARGVSLSDLDLDLFQIPEADPDQTRVEATPETQPRGKTVVYEPEYERIWEGTGRSGNKFPGQKAWRSVGKPSADEVIAGWKHAEKFDRRWPECVPHLSSWLNARGWEDRAAERPRPTNGHAPALSLAQPDPNAPALCKFHEDWKNGSKPSKYPKANCSECKHVGALTRPRTDGEPTPIGELLR